MELPPSKGRPPDTLSFSQVSLQTVFQNEEGLKHFSVNRPLGINRWYSYAEKNLQFNKSKLDKDLQSCGESYVILMGACECEKLQNW